MVSPDSSTRNAIGCSDQHQESISNYNVRELAGIRPALFEIKAKIKESR
jgi:hypothetical protein